MADTEARLRRISNPELTATEQELRNKAYFTTRRYRYFTKPAVARNGSFGFSSVNHLDLNIRPFASNAELLDAYNASMFSAFRDVNVGTLEAFQFDYDSEFDNAWLINQGLSPELAADVLKLASLYRTRVNSLPDHNKPWTLYSEKERGANWDSFTAEMVSNEDGKETMERYATIYDYTAKRRAAEMRALAVATIEQVFPPGSAELTEPQRKEVATRLEANTKPAAILETVYSALGAVTGSATASNKLNAAVERQVMVGGYTNGEALRSSDEKTVFEMWDDVRAFIKREYSGYQVDIAALLPDRPTILPHSAGCFTIGGDVSIGLENAWPKVSLWSTVMHEIKHAIDQRSHAAVEGAAWEGAAVSIERQVWPLFIQQAIPDRTDQLLAQLVTAVDNVRFTARTDATLKTFLRRKGESNLNAFEYAKHIVASYGYARTRDLELGSRRANSSTQYLQYDYGLVMYSDLLAYLQAGVGPTPRVDAYLLQACGMPSPKKNQDSIDTLLAHLRERNSTGSEAKSRTNYYSNAFIGVRRCKDLSDPCSVSKTVLALR